MKTTLSLIILFALGACNSNDPIAKNFSTCKGLMKQMFQHGDQMIELVQTKTNLDAKGLKENMDAISKLRKESDTITAKMVENDCTKIKEELVKDSEIAELSKKAQLRVLKLQKEIK